MAPACCRQERIIRQVAALPYRIDEAGHPVILLITSRTTGRWVLPKGNPIRGLTAHEAAAREAYEEAGIHGETSPVEIGRYRYLKRRKNGTTCEMSVAVFPLAFGTQAARWPEQAERRTGWFPLPEAADAVDEPELKRLIAEFRVPKRGKKGAPRKGKAAPKRVRPAAGLNPRG